MSLQPSVPLAARLWPAPAAPVSAALRFAALTLAGALALTLSAKAQVPFYPVPLTLQTLTLLVLASAFGARLSLACVALYLAEGLAGLPVFAGTPEKGIGLAYMMGPTGGFLIGFLAAAWFVGACADRGTDRSFGRLAAVMAVGHALIFAFGFVWLASLAGVEKAYLGGVAPFYLATLVKTLLAAALMAAARRVARA